MVLSLAVLSANTATTTTMAQRAGADLNGDADLGKIISDDGTVQGQTNGENNPTGEDGEAGQVDPNYVPILPFTE